ncbi:MAG: nucleotidyltransferase family protein [Gammaproteobacteria bacterium]|nr:nucleotidyltransferase family protein [Gammaproteobacteria bacterium]
MTALGTALGTVILAAGAGRRFGGAKQLARWGDTCLLQHAIDSCSGIVDNTTYLVLGAHRQAIESSLPLGEVTVLDNPGWSEGIAASIRTAVSRLAQSHQALLFVAADQVLLTRAHLLQVTDAWHRQPGKICCAWYHNKPGIPALFPAPYYAELLQLKGDSGARKLLLQHPADRIDVPLPEAAIDIDTRAALAQLNCTSDANLH